MPKAGTVNANKYELQSSVLSGLAKNKSFYATQVWKLVQTAVHWKL